jgi:putative sugar O-methyltransferase
MKDTKKTIPIQSTLWKMINQKEIKLNKTNNLKDFKRTDINFRIALWNPKASGIRYLKTLIYNLCSLLSEKDWDKIKKISNRDFGDPIAIKYNGESICLDYLQAFYELEFINRCVDINRLRFLEIGGGYGRTCHAIISNSNVKEYFIVDLKNCLNLSRNYLRKVLSSDKFKVVKFILADSFDLLKNEYFDICINIDSFAEMDLSAVQNYLGYINKHCKYFYTKNPVGKYYDKTLDGHVYGDKIVKIALNMGLLRNVIDIHDNFQVINQARKFVRVYNPGKTWRCIAEQWAKPWSFYWQAMYENRSNYRKGLINGK